MFGTPTPMRDSWEHNIAMSTQNGPERPKTAAESADVSKGVADTPAAQDAGVPMDSLVGDGKPGLVPQGTLVIETAFPAWSDYL